MIYAKTYDNNGSLGLAVSYEARGGFQSFDVPSADHLAIIDGNIEIIEPVPVVNVPSIVSMRQARLALLQFGVLAQVNTALANGTDADKITWEYATEVRREDALVANMATALGLSSADLDSLFTLAASL